MRRPPPRWRTSCKSSVPRAPDRSPCRRGKNGAHHQHQEAAVCFTLGNEERLEKVESTGNRQIILTERGASFGYQNLVVDFRSFPILKKFGYPVVFDVTHSVQLPGGQGHASGGQPEFIEPLARAGVAAGADGIFLETHENPAAALSDGPNALPLSQLPALLSRLKQLSALVRSWTPQ